MRLKTIKRICTLFFSAGVLSLSGIIAITEYGYRKPNPTLSRSYTINTELTYLESLPERVKEEYLRDYLINLRRERDEITSSEVIKKK